MKDNKVLVLSTQSAQSRLFINSNVFINEEALTKYLKESKQMNDSQIADLINFKCLSHNLHFYALTETQVIQ